MELINQSLPSEQLESVKGKNVIDMILLQNHHQRNMKRKFT